MCVNNVIKYEKWLVFLISLCLFLTAQINRELLQFESRFGLFAQEMLHNGLSFFPTVYGQYYPDYPALHTVLMTLSARLFGHFSVIAVLLPSACAAALWGRIGPLECLGLSIPG